MNIALDATYSLDHHLSGVGVYSREILFGLAATYREQRFLFGYRLHRFVRSFRERLPANASRAIILERGLWLRRPRLFHSLNQRVDGKPAKRIVSTFHDLFVLTSEYSTTAFRERFAAQARHAAARSDLIIAVSQFTANQVSDLLGVPHSRVRVIHHGVRPSSMVPAEDAQRENIILHVGAVQKRKNLVRLIEAFERTSPEWRLILAGGPGFEAGAVLERVRLSPRRESIELPGYVSAKELERLYARARIFAFPSLDEGFGMPILDAMARGVPVLTSNRGAMLEVAGEAACLVDPTDSDSIGSGLLKLTQDASARKQLRAAGFQRVSIFSWESAVRKTWYVYKELL